MSPSCEDSESTQKVRSSLQGSASLRVGGEALVLKKDLRRRMADARRRLSPDDHAARSREVAHRMLEALIELLPNPAGACLFAYVPAKGEPDIRAVLEWAWANGAIVLAPRVDPSVRAMRPHPVRGWNDLVSGACGIPEPRATIPPWKEPAAIDLILVPGLAFDRAGYRLGYGGGYYDRFLAELAAVRRAKGMTPELPPLWAAAFSFQMVDELPREAHDIPVDRVFTYAD